MKTLLVVLALTGTPDWEDLKACVEVCQYIYEFCLMTEEGTAKWACLGELKECLAGCKKK